MVADMSEHVGYTSADTVSVCSVGVYGTKYVRSSSSSVPSSVEITQGESQTITIENISSYWDIGNELAINMRQTTSLSFVSLTEVTGSTDVLIDTTGLEVGEYTLTLESFNTLSVA